MFGDVFNKVAQVGGDLKSQWSNWVAQPGNRAFLVNAGLQMLQPIQPGQSPIGNIGQALGQGFEAKGRVERQQLLEEDRDYKRRQQEAEFEAETEDKKARRAEESKRTGIMQQNADSLSTQRKMGVSWNSLFANSNRDQDRFENFIAKQADLAAKADAEANAFDLDYVPRAASDYINDPNWLATQQNAWRSINRPMVGAPATTTLQSGAPAATPQTSAAPIPQPTGATPKYKDGDVVNGYRRVTVNGRVGWQKI